MAKLAKTLLGVLVVCIASGALTAQPQQDEVKKAFDEAVTLLRLNKKAEALEKFREVTKTDPTHAQAWDLWAQTKKEIFEELLLQDDQEIRKIAQFLMARARLARKEMSRDEGTIKGLVQKACTGKYEDQVPARQALRADHGQFAVPALLEPLGNRDDEKGQGLATLALRDIGRDGSLALIEALHSDNATLRVGIIGVLSLLGDHRAKAALANRAATDDQEAVRTVASRALAHMGVGGNTNAQELYLAAAQDYLTGRGELDADPSPVIWTWKDGKVVHTDISPLVYFQELAKRNAEAALTLSPHNQAAQTLVARAYLAQIATIESAASMKDEDGVALTAIVPNLKLVAMASGPAVLRQALTDSVRDHQPAVAVAAIRSLGEVEGKDELESSPLVTMLDHGNKSVAYAAALALSQAARGSTIPSAHKVVSVLAEAVTEKSVIGVEVVGNTEDIKSAKNASSQEPGKFVDSSFSGKAAANKILTAAANVDVMVINEVLADMIPETLIGLIRKEPRTKDMKILIVAADPDKATERFGETINGVIKGPLSGEALDAAIADAVKGIDLDPNRKEAERIAKGASEALATLATDRVNVAEALTSLAGQLDRQDYVARPAARALGEAGGEAQLGALVATIQGKGSLALKIDCARSAGQILGRAPTIDDKVLVALSAVAEDAKADMSLRQAVVSALGKAKLLPGVKLRLIKGLQTTAVKKGGSEEGS